MMNNKQADVCIIGGGLMGCFTALFLADTGRSVILLEKGEIGREASGTNFGNLRIQGRKPEEFPLSVAAHGLWERFETLTGESCGYERCGHAYLAFGEAHHAKLDQYAREANAAGIEVNVLGATEIRRRWPHLSGMVTGATWSPRDGFADPERACPAVGRAAQRSGVEVLTRTRATKIVREKDHLCIVTDQDIAVSCSQILNAAGAWSARIAADLGEVVPLFTAGPPIIATTPIAPLDLPSMLAVDGSIIFRQVKTGQVILSSFPRQPSDLDRGAASIPPERIIRDLGRLADVVPSVRGIGAQRFWSGVEGYLPDMLPVMGPSRTTPDVFHAFGFSGHGFQLAPGVGRVMADVIAKGRSEIPISAFSIARFEAGVADDERLSREFEPTAVAAVTASEGA